MSEDEGIALSETSKDKGVTLSKAVLKGMFGMVPGVGSALAELVEVVIPNYRLERLIDYVKRLNERLSSVEGEAQRRLRDPDCVDLFEDGAVQAVRAVSDVRKERIANIVA